MAFAAALILQHSIGNKPMGGDRLVALKNIVQIDMIAYGVHAIIHTSTSVPTLLLRLSSVFCNKNLIIY